MKKFTEEITELIVHCTATPADRNLHKEDIARYHRQRGFEDVGYHYLICIDGTVEKGRDSDFIGAHCLGHNNRSIGIAYIGGVEGNGCPKDTRTPQQKQSMIGLLTALKKCYPAATIHGHREFAAKACPCFDAGREYENI